LHELANDNEGDNEGLGLLCSSGVELVNLEQMCRSGGTRNARLEPYLGCFRMHFNANVLGAYASVQLSPSAASPAGRRRELAGDSAKRDVVWISGLLVEEVGHVRTGDTILVRHQRMVEMSEPWTGTRTIGCVQEF
jgi:hypothetical protein